MQLAHHERVGARPPGMTPRRATIVGGVGLLHVAAIYALVSGMTTTAVRQIEAVIQLKPVETETPRKTVVVPPQPTLTRPANPTEQTVVKPVITVQTDDTPVFHEPPATPSTQPPADSAPSALGSTHTVPPYPAMGRDLAHQGTVVLQMSISALGDVTSATVVQSSGFAELDRAAVSWVIAHWKYKPALQGGVAMTGQSQAAIKFDLQQANR